MTKMMSDFGIPMDYYDLIAFYGYGIAVPRKEDRINKAIDFIAKVPLNPEQKNVLEIIIEIYRNTDFSDLKMLKIYGGQGLCAVASQPTFGS